MRTILTALLPPEIADEATGWDGAATDWKGAATGWNGGTAAAPTDAAAPQAGQNC
ncbi:MAG: hypothetical protein ABSD44_16910 [Terracidiphilus sp.]